jgi:hypothetical protein
MFKKHFTKTRWDGHMEVPDSGKKVVYDIKSLDYASVEDRYKILKKTVLNIDKEIKRYSERHNKAFDKSPAYADEYCPHDFEITYSGKEDKIFYELLTKVQNDIAEEAESNLKDGALCGVLNVVPIVGDAYAIYKAERNKTFPIVALFGLGFRAGAVARVAFGDFNPDSFIGSNFVGTELAAIQNAHSIFKDAEKLETEKVDITPYLKYATA